MCYLLSRIYLHVTFRFFQSRLIYDMCPGLHNLTVIVFINPALEGAVYTSVNLNVDCEREASIYVVSGTVLCRIWTLVLLRYPRLALYMASYWENHRKAIHTEVRSQLYHPIVFVLHTNFSYYVPQGTYFQFSKI